MGEKETLKKQLPMREDKEEYEKALIRFLAERGWGIQKIREFFKFEKTKAQIREVVGK